MPAGHVYKEEMLPHLAKQIREVARAFGAKDDLTDFDALAEELFDDLLNAKAIIREDHGFAGQYYVYSKSRYASFRTKALEGNSIHDAANRVQGRYFRDQFKGYLSQRQPEDLEFTERAAIVVPASDRLVMIGDNGPEFIDDIQAIRDALREHNDEDGKLLDRRERLDRELSAGQELFKAKTVRLKAVIAVLISTLTFIAKEFAGGAIGDLAAQLLEQLRPLLGI